MSIKNRATLKPKFKTGDKPTETDFKDLLDSYYNKADEPVYTKTEANAAFEAKTSATFGPWVSVTEANANVSPDLRRLGLPVGIIVSGEVLEYWYAQGVEDSDLVEKAGGKVNTVNGVVADQNKNVLIEASDVDYAPAESNNTTGFFAGLLTDSKLKTSAALNYIVSELKNVIDGVLALNSTVAGMAVDVETLLQRIGNMTALTTTAKTSLVVALNEVKAAALTSASDVTKQVSKDLIFRFDEVTIDSEDEIFLTRKVLIGGTKISGQISGVVFYARADSGSYSAVLANFGSVNTWIGANITPGVNYWLKAVQTPITTAYGPGMVTLDFKETV